MQRRVLITLLGGTVIASPAWISAAVAQQTMPVVGLLSGQQPDVSAFQVAAFYEGLKEAGFVEGRNLAIESRWANNDYTRYPAFAADLAQRRVSLIAALAHGSTPAALAAKAATTTIPIVFAVGGDPVQSGLDGSLNRPSGNVTGATFFANDLAAKRLGLLHELLPKATVIAVFHNANFPGAEAQLRDVQEAGRRLQLQILVINASTDDQIDAGFAALAQRPADAAFISADPFLSSRQDRVIALAARHKVPAIYDLRLATDAGGLISYGSNSLDTHRWAGVYAGRILKGEKPGDLPVLQPTKIDLIINLKTAGTLGLEIPAQLLARADEVVE
jgi:putative ABC transport system substrate-binding protein